MSKVYYMKKDCRDVDDLLSCLHEWVLDGVGDEQFYRGQRFLKELKPSLYRDKENGGEKIENMRNNYFNGLNLDHEIWNNTVEEIRRKTSKLMSFEVSSSPLENYLQYYFFELYLLSSFFHLSNKSGLKISYSSFYQEMPYITEGTVRSLKLLNKTSYDQKKEQYVFFTCEFLKNFKMCKSEPLLDYSYEVKIIAAMAQHHGIPTRMLDFTRSPYVAAFFAAFSHIQCSAEEESKNKEKKIGVYRIRIVDKEQSRASFITAIDKTVNRFLFAQEGAFGFIPGDRTFLENNRWPSFEELSDKYGGIEVSRLTLPMDKSLSLLKKLKNCYQISIARLMPHYDYVALELKTLLSNPKITEKDILELIR